jgi:cell division protein ZapA
MVNNEQKTKIQVEVYDELIEVSIVKGEEEKYQVAARFVTERLNTYVELHRGWKSQHTISLMTMLDIALNPMSVNKCKKGHRSIWRKIIEYFKS